VVKVRPQRPFNGALYAFKALGIATGIIGVTAVCAVGLMSWYLDVTNVRVFPPQILLTPRGVSLPIHWL
jgi:hypothetical protein